VDNEVTLARRAACCWSPGRTCRARARCSRALAPTPCGAAAAAGLPSPAAAPVRVWTACGSPTRWTGVSHFLAELRRLHQIVQAAEAQRLPAARPCATAGRGAAGHQHGRAAVRPGHLPTWPAAARSARCRRTTDLADDAERPPGRHVHLRETITSAGGRPAMTFDYRLRPGPADLDQRAAAHGADRALRCRPRLAAT